MLLVPAVKSQSSLDKLGELYSKEVDFSNIIVIDKYKAQMSKFLQRDKEAFEEYAPLPGCNYTETLPFIGHWSNLIWESNKSDYHVF